MRIAVIGCGAMGTIFAGLLADGGNDVITLHRRAGDAQRIMEQGVRVSGASGDRTARVRPYTQAPAEEADLVILAVKADQVAAAAQAAAPLLGPDTIVLAMQNGLGSAADAAAVVGAERLLVGIAGGFGASLVEAGHAHHNGMEIVRMGAYDALDFRRVEAVVDVWRAAGFKSEAARNIAAMQWEKLICNVAYSAPCALTGMTVGRVMDDPHVGPVSRAAAVEAWEVARARGIAIGVADPIAHVREFAAKMPSSRPSLLQDVEAGRPSEIDFINGAIPREAQKAGREAPVNALLTALVKAKEAGALHARN